MTTDQDARAGGARTTQLREYRVRPDSWDRFLEAWLRQVPPLRARRGFEVEAWAVREQHRLVWFLSHPGTVEDFEAADRAYYDSPERVTFAPDPREFLESADHHFVERITL